MAKRRDIQISHEFVSHIPAKRAEGILYVSIDYATAVHNCFCGCGSKIVTPISPTGWRLTFDGDSVSLSPSVGNWALPCHSHYWIEGDRAVWAGDASQEQIDRGRERDRAAREAYFGSSAKRESVVEMQPSKKAKEGLLTRLRKRFFGK
jgi:hypothetical protein